ncbi:MAG TPA: BLUF domain-containing protein [Aliidongia sp.]|nr:BLUF domain-containing protein [Aliidongia sp.]
MFSLVYVSAAVPGFSDVDLAQLLHQSRSNNGAQGVTGLLLHVGGNFMQVLEGTRAAVEQTFERIAADTRHHNLLVLLRFDLPERQFPDWSMALCSLADLPPAERAGFAPALERWRAQPADRAVPDQVQIMIGSFIRSMR